MRLFRQPPIGAPGSPNARNENNRPRRRASSPRPKTLRRLSLVGAGLVFTVVVFAAISAMSTQGDRSLRRVVVSALSQTAGLNATLSVGRLAAAVDEGGKTFSTTEGTAAVVVVLIALAFVLVFIWGAMLFRRQLRGRVSRQRTDARVQARYRALVDKAADLVFITDSKGRVSYISRSAETFLGTYDAPIELAEIVHPEDHQAFTALLTTLSPNGEADSVECRLREAAASWRSFEDVATDLRSDPAVGGVVLTARDVTERKALQDQVAHQAMHDSLTGLPNRVLFADRLGHALARAARSGANSAVLYIDLDEFKAINDAMGHVAGDQLLRIVSERLQSLLRWSDTLCRLGGDEFAILLEETDLETARSVGHRILDVLGTDIVVGGSPVRTSASVGVAVSGLDQVLSSDQILSAADGAMYVAKRSGRNRVVAYDAEMQIAARRWAQLLGDLRGALDREELWVAYQPIMSCQPGVPPTIYGVEALVRWRSPSWGSVSPTEFIPLAEEGGIIGQLGNWVLQEASSVIASINAEREHPLRLSVNVSVRQLDSPDFVVQLQETLANSGLPIEQFTAELTESLMIHQSAASVLAGLREIGARVSLDDFGTGYASLAQLSRLAVDQLKIDIEFVRLLGRDRGNDQLTASIVSLGKTLGLEVVAEGVENVEQVEALLQMGCRRMQGFFFGKPMSATDLRQMLEERDGAEKFSYSNAIARIDSRPNAPFG